MMRWAHDCTHRSGLALFLLLLTSATFPEATTAGDRDRHEESRRRSRLRIYNYIDEQFERIVANSSPDVKMKLQERLSQVAHGLTNIINAGAQAFANHDSPRTTGNPDLPGAVDAFFNTDPWMYLKLEFTNLHDDYELVSVQLDQPIVTPQYDNVYLGFLDIELRDTNQDGYVFAGEFPNEPPDEDSPLSTFFFEKEGHVNFDYTGRMGVSLVEPGTQHFTFGPFAGPIADQVDAMRAHLNFLLSAGDTVVLEAGFIQIAELVPGDYNFDGTVDAADYTVWRDSLGDTGLALAADGTGPEGVPDELVDALDYELWRTHFGQSYEPLEVATAPAPEPATLSLLTIGAGLFCCRRKIRQHAL